MIARHDLIAQLRDRATIGRFRHVPRSDMMELMKGRTTALFSVVVLLTAICSGQTPTVPAGRPHYIEIKLPPNVISESFVIRYVLMGEDFGGWVQPLAGVSSYVITTTHEGRPATEIKAILYTPGCAIQTLDLALSGATGNPQYAFICQPVRSITLAGVLIRTDRLYGHEVKLQARYVARWAQPFLGLDDAPVMAIPVGDVGYPAADGRFRLLIPDLSQDPVAGAQDHAGELQIWAKDKISEAIVAQLVPNGTQPSKTRMGGLKVQSGYPSEIVFAPCAANPRLLHDKIGFAIRPDYSDACDR